MAAARNIGKVLPRCKGLLGSRALSSGRGDSDDVNLDSIFADVPPATSGQGKAASSQEGQGSSQFWQSLLKKPPQKVATPSNWDFLQELEAASKKSRWEVGSSSSPSSSASYRNMADSGIDFLKEQPDRPAPTQRETASPVETELGEESLIYTASFKVLRDSFRYSSPQPRRDKDKQAADESLGFDTSALFDSTEASPKGIDSRTLSEVEHSFYSTMGESSLLESKTYSFEELGERLRKVRPPKEQILHSATGLSFGELRARLEKIEQEDNKEVESKEANYRDLKESLHQLRGSNARKLLTHEELTFVNSTGLKRPGVRIEYTPPSDDLLTKYYSEVQLSSKERLKLEIKKLKVEFQAHEYDTGSPQVQIALLTARINNLNRHMREGRNYKRDKHSRKGLSDMVQYRKRLLRYLRRRDWPAYCNVLTKLKLDDVILEKRH